MEDDTLEGPFAVWKMFNAPTLVLYNNLEHAADGLERLFTSIMKLSGDYSEVLVPKHGSSKYPEDYFLQFDRWLLGRLFYIWSVDKLVGIHDLSMTAQLKILNTLNINNSKFYNIFLMEYINVLQDLHVCYKKIVKEDTVLKHFASKSINVPNVELNFEPIYVKVTNVETCQHLINLTLGLISTSLTFNPWGTVFNNECHNLNLIILDMFQNYNIDIKVMCLEYFASQIGSNQVFSDFLMDSFIQMTEALILLIPKSFEKGEIKGQSERKLNSALIKLLETPGIHYFCKESIETICTNILQVESSLYNQDLKKQCLALSSKLELPKDVLSLQNKDSNEITLLREYYVKQITSKDTITKSWWLEQLFEVFNSLEGNYCDMFLVKYNLDRCCSVLRILQEARISDNSFVLPEKFSKIVKVSTNDILAKSSFVRSGNNSSTFIDVVLASAILNRELVKDDLLCLLCLQKDSLFSNNSLDIFADSYYVMLRSVLATTVFLQWNLDDVWCQRLLHLLNKLMNNKEFYYKEIVDLCPLLKLNKIYFESKLISDILMPAFLTKDKILQNKTIQILKSITCMSFGSVKLVMTLENMGHVVFSCNGLNLCVICSKCHSSINENSKTIELASLNKNINNSDNTFTKSRSLFAKFLNTNVYADLSSSDIVSLVNAYSNHDLFNVELATELYRLNSSVILNTIQCFIDNVMKSEQLDEAEKDSMLNVVVQSLVKTVKSFLSTNNLEQKDILDCIMLFGTCKTDKVLLPSTKLTVYFITHPQCSMSAKAVLYLRKICEAHNTTPNQVYQKYKKDYCCLFVDCCLYNGKDFTLALLKVVKAFGFIGYRDFISKDIHHFLPYLVPYCTTLKEVPKLIQEIASLVQCSVSDFLAERFPHVYTHVFLHENDQVSKKCFDLIEKLTRTSILNLVKRHFRVILTEFLLQYCCNPEKVLNACKYLACHDPDVSTPNGNLSMTTSQVADFLQPKFLGILAYFDHKLVNTKVALSVKRKALQSFPDIMNLMGAKYLTPLRYKVLATLRSAMSLMKEFPKILAAAWSGFIFNIDTLALGSLLTNLAVSLLPQHENAPHEVNKIFQYLVLNNENLLSSHISDLFFLEDTKISDKVRMAIRKHVKRIQPELFLEKIKWFLQHLDQDVAVVKVYAFTHLDKLIKSNRSDVHKAIFGGKNIDPVLVELIDCLLDGCRSNDSSVSLASGGCLGQLCAIEAAHLPRQYVQHRSSFAFSINDDCFAATALVELTRAFQYENDTLNMDCYALTIQEILKIYNISPSGNKKNVWDSFPENMHQIMHPLLSSRYTLAFPSQPKKAHPLFGSSYATTFLEWAHNWAGQLIPLIESESVQDLLRTVHPSMRRDVRTLFLFLPYVLLHAVMGKKNLEFIQEEILAVIGLENFNNHKQSKSDTKYKLLRHVRLTPTVSSLQAEEGNQSKCRKMIYTLLDFLNRWMLEWCNSKQHPLQNENYKSISTFMQKFDKLAVARGNFMCGEFERALQYLELYMHECSDHMQHQLSFLAEIYALLDEPDSVAGILSIKRSEPSLKELILAQVVTGRLQDAAVCYERLAQGGQLDKHSLQGMVDCYLGLDQPFTAHRLLLEMGTDDCSMELAEPLWRLGRFDELDKLAQKPIPPSKENWGLLMGRILLSYRSQNHEAFTSSCQGAMARLLSQMDGEAKGENALRTNYQTILGLHIVKEATHVEEIFLKIKSQEDNMQQCSSVIDNLIEEWRRRLCVVQSDVKTIEPLLRIRRILLLQTQELLQPTHPVSANKLKTCIGDLWLQSAKYARKAGIFQQSYMYVLNAEEYQLEELFLEKAKMYWARGQHEHAFTTLKRGLEELYPDVDKLTQDQRKIYAKAKLLIAKYNDETTNVDVDVNIGYYKEAVDVFKQWEKSLVCLGAYYEKVSSNDQSSASWSRKIHALNSYGKALQYGHKYLYQSMPRMLSIWLDVEITASDIQLHTVLAQMTEIIKTYSERLPLYLYLTAFSQIVSRICHPVKEVYLQLKAIIVKLILAYPQHTLWMMMSVIKSSYPQRIKRCQDVFSEPRLKEPQILKLVNDFTQLAEKLIELCNKPIAGNSSTTTVTSLVRTLPRLLSSENFSRIMMPFEQFCKIVLPSKAARHERLDFNIAKEPPVYIAGIEEQINILPSLQKPRKVTLRGSDGKTYIIMLKPRDDLRKDYRLMEFNGVVNRFLQDAPETRRRRLYIRTYSVLPLNEECGLIEWVPNLVGLRPILMHIYKQKGKHTSNRELKEMMCSNKDPVEKKRKIFEEQLLPKHPPVFQEWFRRVFSDPYGWYQARSAYIRTTAVMSMVGYILGLGDRHGENISFDSTNGDTVHVDFNCLFNKGEAFEWPERVPFRLTHNMEAAMGPLKHEGMYRKSCEAVMRALRAQTAALMSVIGPFVYDPLVSWGRVRPVDCGERTNEQALQHLQHIRQRLNGMVKTKNKQLSLSLSPEGQVEHLIVEATSIHNLCQMYIGWGPFL